VNARLGIVRAILAKDLREFARDRFYVLVSIVGLVFYVVVFWVLPATVDETVGLGVHLEGGGSLVTGLGLQVASGQVEGLEVVAFDSGEELSAAIESGERRVVAGLDFPAGFLQDVAAGVPVTVRVLLPGDAPEELRPALAGLVRELSYAVAGEAPPVTPPDLQDVVVGPDRVGQQVSIRERMRPMFLFFVLLVEMFALAALVAAEIHERTITAVLVTPARVSDVLVAKATLGTLLAFSQGLLLLLVTGSATSGFLLLATALLLGAILVTGVALIAGSTGRDFVGIVFWSVLFMIPLAVPAFSTLFPGAAAAWVQALPTYGLVQVLIGVTAYGEGWADSLPDLASLLVWCVVVIGIGVTVLGRRVARV
jgi:ABC-2 type transport system permease protein